MKGIKFTLTEQGGIMENKELLENKTPGFLRKIYRWAKQIKIPSPIPYCVIMLMIALWTVVVTLSVLGISKGRDDLTNQTIYEQKLQETKKERYKHEVARWVYNKTNRISRSMAQEIVNSAMKTEHPLLVLGLCGAESDFVPSARSPKGAMGIGQINPVIYTNILIKANIIKEARDLYNIDEGIKAASFAIGYELGRNKYDITKALECYLGGKDGKYVNQVLVNIAHLYLIKNGGAR